MFKKTILKNGLRLVIVPIPSAQSATVLALVGTGSNYETKELNGISHFLEHMFFKGTKNRPSALAVAEVLDRVGGQYNAFTSKEVTGFYAKLAPEYLETGLEWVADILLNSKFEEAEIEREKGVIVEEINMYLDMPQAFVGELWEEALYGDQPAGRPVIGSKENVMRISRRDFLDYVKIHYHAKNIIVCVAGKIPDEKELATKVEKYFKGLAAGEGSGKAKTSDSQSIPQSKIHFKKTDQTHLCLGVRGYNLFHPDRLALKILSAILGGMMSSRMFISLREEKGLAYYVRTGAEKYTDSGYVMTQAGVTNDKVEEAIKAILDEYRKIRDEKVNEDEIKKAKDHLKGITRLNLETSDQLASWIGAQEILEKQVLTPEEVFAKIEAVSSVDLSRVAKDIFRPEKLNLALIGPFKDEERFKKLLNL